MSNTAWLGLDIGSRRIGVAIARMDVRIPRPLTTLENNEKIFTELQDIIKDNEIAEIVAGLPRDMSSRDTEQTKFTEEFVNALQKHVNISVKWQDEALTSEKAEAELSARKKPFEKGDVDALAATFILEDYINEHVRGSYV